MAPFKLKFRTGSSRNTSQEIDNSSSDQQQTNQSLLNYSNLSEIGASSSTIDSTADCTSIESYGTNDRKLLLANNGNNIRIGYMNPTLSQSEDCVESNSSQLSYDHSSEENIQDNMEGENLTLTTFDSENCLSDDCSVREMQRENSQEQISMECTDPECKIFNAERNQTDDGENVSHNETISSTEYLLTSTTMTAKSNDDNLLVECTDDYCEQHSSISLDRSQSHSQLSPSGDSQRCYSMNDGGENQNNSADNQWNQTMNQNENYRQQHDEITIPEIINNKSSKKIYKAMAKQSGITCKMSDQCRCMECQSHYFDCEFDDNDHQKTDGGLGAGTPMFISEVMHGSACTIL